MSKFVFRSLSVAVLGLCATPALAQPRNALTLGGVFADAAPSVKAVVLLLVLAIAAAVALTAIARRSPARSLAVLGAIAAGAPLLGLAGALFTLLSAAVGVANLRRDPPLFVLAPAFAEALLVMILALLATLVAVAARELLKPRLDAGLRA